MSTMIGPF